ncbi:uncharacterized protein LOC117198897 [Orcinus orca]|uniref:uncharacterized protein LOC117198897 n=1 Tax=Orcinus orca TaxID=9733 RepID=UPI00144191C2|nr:uncharacterized protein LOC117198897 [Orcinus orca]
MAKVAGREDAANFTLLPSRPGGPASFRSCGRVRLPGPRGACVTAALLHFSPGAPYSPVPSSEPRIPGWCRFFPAAVSSGSLSSASTQRDGASPPGGTCPTHRPFVHPPATEGKILNHLKILKGDRDRIRNFQSTGQHEIQALLAKFQNHKQDIASVFEQGHQFLREREQYLLKWLDGMEQELTEGRNSHVTKGSGEVIQLETLIYELEKKARQPALELWQISPVEVLD